uniref:Uncharacterized protein n=1 Tax=Solanum tuberosum TaxID=4113 RepID=M1CYX1_SOLTU
MRWITKLRSFERNRGGEVDQPWSKNEVSLHQFQPEIERFLCGILRQVQVLSSQITHRSILDLQFSNISGIWIEEQSMDTNGQKEQVPVFQALKEKIKMDIEMSSGHVAEWFRNAMLDRPKLQNLRMLKAKEKRRWN